MVTLPFDFSAAEDAIHDWFSTATGLTTVWRDQSAPQPAYPYGSLLIIAGPTKLGGQDEVRESTDLTIVQNVKVTPIAQNDTLYTVTMHGDDFTFLSDASATVAEITAGLTSAINGGAHPITVSATDNGTDLDIIAPTETFTLVVDDDFDGNQMSFANNDLGHEVLQEVAGLRDMTISCQVYVSSPDVTDPTKHSRALMTAAQASLGLPSELARFQGVGLAIIEEGDVLNIDELIEDAFVSRANMDVRFGLASNLSERTGFIQATEISSDMGLPASLELDDERIGD